LAGLSDAAEGFDSEDSELFDELWEELSELSDFLSLSLLPLEEDDDSTLPLFFA
jgi:hypothetical protein